VQLDAAEESAFSLSFAAVTPTHETRHHPLQPPTGLPSPDMCASPSSLAATTGSISLHSLLYDAVARPELPHPPRTPLHCCPPSFATQTCTLGCAVSPTRAPSAGAPPDISELPGSLALGRRTCAPRKAFPCSRRRVPVVEVQEAVLNPLEAAVLALRDKNVALRDATKPPWLEPTGPRHSPSRPRCRCVGAQGGDAAYVPHRALCTSVPWLRRAWSTPSSLAGSPTTSPSLTAPTAPPTPRWPRTWTRRVRGRRG